MGKNNSTTIVAEETRKNINRKCLLPNNLQREGSDSFRGDLHLSLKKVFQQMDFFFPKTQWPSR